MRAMQRSSWAVAILALALCCVAAKEAKLEDRQEGFDYFYLVRYRFTLHGLWPQRNDGTWPEFCNPDSHLQMRKLWDLMPFLALLWPSWSSDNVAFWGHEWTRHGTCAGLGGQHHYFKTVLKLHRKLNVERALDKSDIEPSRSATYPVSEIEDAIISKHGVKPHVTCDYDGNLAEIWMCINKDLEPVDCKDGPHPHSNNYCSRVRIPPLRRRHGGNADKVAAAAEEGEEQQQQQEEEGKWDLTEEPWEAALDALDAAGDAADAAGEAAADAVAAAGAAASDALAALRKQWELASSKEGFGAVIDKMMGMMGAATADKKGTHHCHHKHSQQQQQPAAAAVAGTAGEGAGDQQQLLKADSGEQEQHPAAAALAEQEAKEEARRHVIIAASQGLLAGRANAAGMFVEEPSSVALLLVALACGVVALAAVVVKVVRRPWGMELLEQEAEERDRAERGAAGQQEVEKEPLLRHEV